MPNTYHSTTSVLSIDRLANVHRPRPVSCVDWFTNSPAGQRSSGRFGVTHRVWPITLARSSTGDSGSNIGGIAPLVTSLYDGWLPRPFTTLLLTTFQLRWVAKLTSCLAWLSVRNGTLRTTSERPCGLSGP